MMQIFAKLQSLKKYAAWVQSQLVYVKKGTFDCCFHFSVSSECFQVSHLLCLFVFYFVPDLLPMVLNYQKNTNQVSLKSK